MPINAQIPITCKFKLCLFGMNAKPGVKVKVEKKDCECVNNNKLVREDCSELGVS